MWIIDSAGGLRASQFGQVTSRTCRPAHQICDWVTGLHNGLDSQKIHCHRTADHALLCTFKGRRAPGLDIGSSCPVIDDHLLRSQGVVTRTGLEGSADVPCELDAQRKGHPKGTRLIAGGFHLGAVFFLTRFLGGIAPVGPKEQVLRREVNGNPDCEEACSGAVVEERATANYEASKHSAEADSSLAKVGRR